MKDAKMERAVESKELARKMTELEEYTGMTFQMESSEDGRDYKVLCLDSMGRLICLHPRENDYGVYHAILYTVESRTFQEELENVVDDIYFKIGETEKSIRMKLELMGRTT